MRIVAISDTHLEKPDLPNGDLLIHCGDFTYSGFRSHYSLNKKSEPPIAYDWIKTQAPKFKKMVGVAGNHDFDFQKDTLEPWMTLLFDELIEFEGLKIYGTPYVPRYFDWAFMKSEAELEEIYSNIPEGIDILITHGPPYGILDKNKRGDWCGSVSLLNQLKKMEKPPKYCFFGHIHRDLNSSANPYFNGKTYFYNVSYMNEWNSPDNDIVVIDI